VIGRLGPDDFMTDEDKATFRHRFARLLAEGVAEDHQFDLVGRDGTTRRVGVSANAQWDADGRFIRVLSVMYDQTALHEAEQLRLKAATIEAENRALTDFARAKGQFLSSMSHELRTPLNGVLGFAQLMQGSAIGPDSPKYAQYLAQINASGRQLLSLIDALLDASRLQAGTLNFTPQRVDLVHLVVDTVESYRPAALAKHMDLGSRVEQAGPAYLDPMRFRQVLGALLSNAIKFSRAQTEALVRVEHEGTDCMRVTVEDQGPGIAAADLARLFVPFSQLSVGTTRSHDGAGLGLSLVKQLVESQGGSVGVRSTPGVGSSFHFVLPIRPPS
jgi:signal transduction histidine kinase